MRKIMNWPAFNQNAILQLLQILGSILLLISPAIINGFPLLYSDSASYIVSGQDGNIPIDRPIIYGFLITQVSLSLSLWLVVIFQALIVVLLINRLLSYFDLGRVKSFATFLVVLFLSIFTGVSNYISQVMPDIYTGVLIIAFPMLILEPDKRWRWFLFLVALSSSMMHFSNLPLTTVLSIMALVVMAIYKKRVALKKRLVVYFSILAILPWLLVPTINYLYSGKLFLNKSNHIFFTGRLIDTGCLAEFFDSVPGAQKYSLYQAKDRIPKKSWEFIWNETSPLYDGGCSENGGWSNCWREKEQEYNAMIWDVLSTRSILAKFLKASFVDWAKQIIDFDTGPLIRQGETSGFSQIIPKYFIDASCYQKSKQYNETLTFETGSLLQRWCIYTTILVLLLLMIRPFGLLKERKDELRMIVALVVTGLMANAFFCAVFSTVLYRYQGRIIWLIPLLVGSMILMLLSRKYTSQPDSPNGKKR